MSRRSSSPSPARRTKRRPSPKSPKKCHVSDPLVAAACAKAEPRLRLSDLRPLFFEVAVRFSAARVSGPWPASRVLDSARQLRASELGLDLLHPSDAALYPVEWDAPKAARRMALLERTHLDALVAKDPREIAQTIARAEHTDGKIAHVDTLIADLTQLLAHPGALILSTLSPPQAADMAAIPSERPMSWAPTGWSPDAALALADSLEKGALTLPRAHAVVARGGEPALDAIGAEMLRVQKHPFASSAFADLLAKSARPRDVMRLVTYFAVVPDPQFAAPALGACLSPELPTVLVAWLSSMLPADGAPAPPGEDPATSSGARLSACVGALRPYPMLYAAVRPLLSRVSSAPPPSDE